MSSWQRDLALQLRRRDASERYGFEDVFSSYTRLLQQKQALSTRLLTKEAEVIQLRQSAGSSSSTEANSEEVKMLRQKLNDLQEELMSSYRMKSEHATTLLKLKEQAEQDQLEVLACNEKVEQAKKELAATKLAVEGEQERNQRLSETIEVMRQEIAAAREQAKTSTTKLDKLEKDNAHLVSKILAMKHEQSEKLNEIAEMHQDAQKKQEMAERARARLASAETKKAIRADIDYADANSILDAAAWRSNFNVQVPDKKQKVKHVHQGAVAAVRYNSAGTLLASAGFDHVVRITDTRTFANRGALRGSKGALMSVQFSPNEQMLLATGNDKCGYIWSLENSKILHNLVGHSSKVYASAFSIDSTRVITGSHDRTIRAWDLKSNSSDRINCNSACNYLSLSPNGNLVGSAHMDCHIRFWSLRSLEKMHEIGDIHSQQVTSIEFSKDGTQFVSNSRDNHVKLVDIRTWKVIREFTGTTKHEYVCGVNWNRACFSPDCQYILAGSQDGSMFVWRTDNGSLESVLKPDTDIRNRADSNRGDTPKSCVSGVDWNSNGRQFLSCDHAGNITFFSSTDDY